MDNKRTYYSMLIIAMTILTVVAMLNLQIKTDLPRVYDKLDTEDRYGEDQNDGFNEVIVDIDEDNDRTKVEDREEEKEVQKEEDTIIEADIRIDDRSKRYRTFKHNQAFVDIENSFTTYDEATLNYLRAQMEASIKRAKVEQFQGWLSQDEVIPAVSLSEIEERLDGQQRDKLMAIVDKIGPINNIKLMAKLGSGVSPREQKEVYELLREKLTDDEIVLLRDILGRYMRPR